MRRITCCCAPRLFVAAQPSTFVSGGGGGGGEDGERNGGGGGGGEGGGGDGVESLSQRVSPTVRAAAIAAAAAAASPPASITPMNYSLLRLLAFDASKQPPQQPQRQQKIPGGAGLFPHTHFVSFAYHSAYEEEAFIICGYAVARVRSGFGFVYRHTM